MQKNETAESIIIKLFDNTDGSINNTYYSEVYGFSKNVTTYRNFTHLYAKIFFKLLHDVKLDYYVFAGTSIGYIRNKQNIPWVDDYDIIIFEEEIDNFKNNIVPKLDNLGFNCVKTGPPPHHEGAGYHILSRFGQKCFQCDVFFTIISKNGILKNKKEWGLYHSKNIHINMVRPKKYLTIDNNLTLPFFNNMSKDIETEYGNVFNSCSIHIDHGIGCKIDQHFTKVYDSFNKVKNRIIDNTKKLFVNHTYNNNETHYDYNKFINQFKFEQNNVLNHIAVLKYIQDKKIKTWNIADENFLIFCPDIKFYFKHITINFYILGKIDKKNLILLNYVDNMFYSNKEYIYNIQKEIDIVVLSKPKIDCIKVITFGTFDLFHIGHTNILKRAKEYGKLFVGVSTDELNLKKGKTHVNNLEHRKNDVKNTNYADHIFHEESLELKNEYVKNYGCNLLIMGDDWENAFNFCDCACIYLKRTPGISTTMLKNNLIL